MKTVLTLPFLKIVEHLFYSLVDPAEGLYLDRDDVLLQRGLRAIRRSPEAVGEPVPACMASFRFRRYSQTRAGRSPTEKLNKRPTVEPCILHHVTFEWRNPRAGRVLLMDTTVRGRCRQWTTHSIGPVLE